MIRAYPCNPWPNLPLHFKQRPITRILNRVPSEPNSRVVSSFIDYLKVEKGLGTLTVSAYTRDIAQFAAFLDRGKRTLLNARKDEVRGFIQQLFANAVDGRSVAENFLPSGTFIVSCCSTAASNAIPR